MGTKHTDVEVILNRWPDRQAVADDAGVEPIAVYRWGKRNSIPARHDQALLKGARKRRIRLKAHELISLRAPKAEQVGHVQHGGEHGARASGEKDSSGNNLASEGVA